MNASNRRNLLRSALVALASTRVQAERVNAKRLSFDIEARVPVEGVTAAAPIVYPPEVTLGLSTNAIETRVRYRFPLGERDVLGIQVFLVPPSSPYPLPEPPLPTDQTTTVAYFEVDVYDIVTIDSPSAIISLAGPIVRTTGSPFGDLTGILTYLTFQYLPGSPTRFRAIFGGSAGVITTNAASGVGTLEWRYRMP